jgi:hypothetical protein
MDEAIYCAVDSNDGIRPMPLCTRCYTEAFSPSAWTKLQGLHPKTTGRFGNFSDPVHDGESAYTVIWLYDRKNLPRLRHPILRLRRRVGEVLASAAACALCRVVCDLDGEGLLRSGLYVDTVVDLQLYYAEACSGVRLPWLLSVGLELEREGRRGKMVSWQQHTLLAMLFDDHESFGPRMSGPVSGEDDVGLAPGLTSRPPAAVEDDIDVGALGLLSNARMWMEECRDSHAECVSLATALLPTRVLQVQAHNDTFTVRLVESAKSRQNRCYTALSYVWGTRPTLRLLGSTRSAFLEDVPFDELPKTMQDAVRVTYALGVPNIWIDALCIMQDDDADKERELPHMNGYYQHASAVISASGASDAHMGFLVDQPSARSIFAKARARAVFTHWKFGAVPYRIPFNPGTPAGIGGVDTCILDTQPSLYSHDAEPINKRGWTLQESILAKRLLVFPSTGGLIARCDRGVRCFGEVLGDPFHGETGLVDYSEGTIDADSIESGEESDTGMLGASNLDLACPVIDFVEMNNADQSQAYEDPLGETGLGHCSGKTVDEENANKSGQRSDDKSVKRVLNVSEPDLTVNDGKAKAAAESEAGVGTEHTVKHGEAAQIAIVVEEWSATVQNYTQRNLTHPGDILIALGALAKVYHGKHGRLVGSYAAGLWSGTLLQGLMWHTSITGDLDADEPSMFSKGIRHDLHAPSWSWASCGRPVTFRTDREPDVLEHGHRAAFRKGEPDVSKKYKPEEPEWCIEVLDCVTTPSSELNPFGAVIGDHLDVKGMLLPIEHHREKRKGEYYRSTRDGSAVMFTLADSGKSNLYDCEMLSADSPSAAASMLSDVCFWMPVYDATRGRTRGLIIRQEADGSYRRLGFAQFVFARAESVGLQTIRIV